MICVLTDGRTNDAMLATITSIMSVYFIDGICATPAKLAPLGLSPTCTVGTCAAAASA